jgi:hypothetical protein
MDVALQYTDGRSERHRLSFGELRRLPLPVGATAQAVIEPSRRFDVGAGPGKPREAVLHGGVAGIILDARGRPLSFPIEPGANAAQRRRDHEALQLPLPAGAGR